jgi:hypothetical protein
MTFQPINFAAINPIQQVPDTGNSFAKILQGMNVGAFPEKHRNEMKSKEFANAIKEAEARHAPENEQYKAMENKAKGMYAEEKEKTALALNKAHAGYWEKGGSRGGAGGGIWKNIPQDTRAKMISITNALDISPEELVRHINDGGTMEELKEQARGKGYDVDNIEREYDPTGATRTALQSIESAADEVDYLEKKMESGISIYGPTISGYSPEQIADAISNDDPEKQATFLASRALQPEMAGARSRLAGGSNSHESLKDMERAALGEFKIIEAFLTPEVRALTQKKINEWLNGAAKVRTRTMKGQKPRGNKSDAEVFEGEVKKVPKKDDPLGWR